MRRIFALATLVFIAQLILAWRFPGFLTGDEVEVLGEAFRRATGFAYGTWNIRNVFVPDVLVAPLIWIATHLGITNPAALIVIATIPFALASSITIVLVYRLAERWTGDAVAANASAVLFALHWLPLGFGSTTYPRVIAMACVTGAALLVARFPGAAGALIGVAFADRYSEIVYLLPLLIVARRRAWHVAAGAFASIALLAGVFDWITWGEPFASLRNFAHLTLVERDFASRIKQQSPFWYLETLPRWCALTMIPLVFRGAAGFSPPNDRWAKAHRSTFVAIPLIALSLVAHKEIRYLQGIIPFLAILAGAGFAAWWRTRRALAMTLLALSLAWNLWGIRFLGRESRPAVEAARSLRNARVHTVAISQPWACGDRLYLGADKKAIELGVPPRNVRQILAESDAAILYETDITPDVDAALVQGGYVRAGIFRAPRARDVVVLKRRGN